MFIDAIADRFSEHATLVGFCDLSATRMRWHNDRLKARGHDAVPCYLASDFDRAVREVRPDVVIVCTMDSTHHTYIVRAMELGCDVISEKPMTTDEHKAAAILDAVQRTGQSLRVTFNVRYSPQVSKVKQLLMDGAVGTPTAVDLTWALDTRHGADYFRRWHATRANSGGLLVHKATHHFDLVNWWLDAWPATVFSMGSLRFYGRDNATQRGESYSYDRYTGSPAAKDDPFALFLDQDAGNDDDDVYSRTALRGLYLDAEADSGYVRDQNVFGDHVDIEDTMAVMARYRSGAVLNYSLVAYSPWEGFRLAITGTRGRIELCTRYGSHIIAKPQDAAAATQPEGSPHALRVLPMFGAPYDVDVPAVKGGHGGADPLLLADLLGPDSAPDPCHRRASHLDGAASLLVGVSANHSIATGMPVQCDDLLPLPPKALPRRVELRVT